ncbi:MAG TPA: hypothetical protein VLB84_12920 [Bacteroidia bacterium]|jgi:hypothetical protein|nr:hypothetical protein [Bacteroidia bacterium]
MKINKNANVTNGNLKTFLEKIDSFDKRMEQLKSAIGSPRIPKEGFKMKN